MLCSILALLYSSMPTFSHNARKRCSIATQSKLSVYNVSSGRHSLKCVPISLTWWPSNNDKILLFLPTPSLLAYNIMIQRDVKDQ